MNNTSQIKIRVEHGKLEPIMGWCREHCVGRWRVTDEIDDQGATYGETYGWPRSIYAFVFEDERDLIMFELRWSGCGISSN